VYDKSTTHPSLYSVTLIFCGFAADYNLLPLPTPLQQCNCFYFCVCCD